MNILRRLRDRIVGPRAPALVELPVHEILHAMSENPYAVGRVAGTLLPDDPSTTDTVLDAMLDDDGLEPLDDDEFNALMDEAMQIEDDAERIRVTDELMARWLPQALATMIEQDYPDIDELDIEYADDDTLSWVGCYD